jgi:predicted cupin superfamily sugar epimerase
MFCIGVLFEQNGPQKTQHVGYDMTSDRHLTWVLQQLSWWVSCFLLLLALPDGFQ